MALGAATLTTPVRGEQVSVFPTRIDFAAGKQSASVTVGNNTSRTLTLQPSAVRWQQIAGEEQQEPTRDVLTAPPLVEIAPGAQQVVRLSLRVPPDANRELPYRLLLREVPPADKDGNAASVKFLLNLSLPVFVAPSTAVAAPKIVAQATYRPAARNSKQPGSLSLLFSNSGSGHVQVTEIISASGPSLAAMFYVLPGGERRVELPWPDGLAVPATVSLTLKSGRGQLAVDAAVRR